MKLTALVMCRVPAAVKVLFAAFAELGVEYRIAFSAAETLDILSSGRYSALVVDFDLPFAAEALKSARALDLKQRPVLFGMAGRAMPVAGVFQAGANFVLYKPLDPEQVLHSFRAARAFMRQDRRSQKRQQSETLGYVQLPGGTIPVLVHELTEQGFSIQAAEELTPQRGVSLRFLLPGTTQVVRATGDFIWTDKFGRAGFYFTDIPAASRRDLAAWLRKRSARKSESPVFMEAQRSQRAAAAH
jgi:DNA-binding response OmpR family regulator